MKRLLALLLSGLTFTAQAQAPVTVLGLNSRDKILPGFWAQNQNASNLVSGINANTTNRFTDALMPEMITGRLLSGTFYTTNDFEFKSWDVTAGNYQTYNFYWDDGEARSPNTVARIGAVEALAFKTLAYSKFASASTYFDGILKANGTNYASAISGWSGTNNIWLGGTNYFTIVDGVITGYSGGTNIVGTGVESINGLAASALNITTNSTGTDFNISASGTNISINLPTASASNRGALSAADWTTFNSKANGTDTLTALGAYNANGLMVQVSQNTFAGRLIVSGDGSLEIVNGDGVSGDIDIRMSGTMFYIPSDSSAPVDPPASYLGKTAMIYDTTAHRIWVYDGSEWRYIATTAP